MFDGYPQEVKREPLSEIQERTMNFILNTRILNSEPTGQVQQERDAVIHMAYDHLSCLQENLIARQNQTEANYS